MSAEAPSPVDPPAPRRDSWSLRTIVEEVSGQSLEDFQDPARAPHPYLLVKPPKGHAPAHRHEGGRRAALSPEEYGPDPEERVYPPLVGRVGRELHEAEQHHHAETLHHLANEPGAAPGRPASPLRRPERVYLHYLLLHMDRLSDNALRYLQLVVEEELAHRGPARPAASDPARTSP